MTTKKEIEEWFDRGVLSGSTHMIVCVDTFDYEDYPVFAINDEDAKNKYASHNGVNMQRVMEVYDLRMEKLAQLNANRVYNLPK